MVSALKGAVGPHPGCFFQGCWGRFPGCFLYRSLGPLPGSWVKKKQATVTSGSPTNYQMEGTHQNQFRCSLPTSSPLKKEGKPLLPAVANSHSKGGARPPCDFPELFNQTKRHTTKRGNTLISKKAHIVRTVTKSKGIKLPESNSQECARRLQTTHSRVFGNFSLPLALLLFFFLSPHPSPLLSQPVHGERKAFVCCDS